MTALLVISVLVTGTYLLHRDLLCVAGYTCLVCVCCWNKEASFSNESVSTRQTWLLISRVCYSESGRAGRLVGVLGLYLTQGRLCPSPLTGVSSTISLSCLAVKETMKRRWRKGGGDMSVPKLPELWQSDVSNMRRPENLGYCPSLGYSHLPQLTLSFETRPVVVQMRMALIGSCLNRTIWKGCSGVALLDEVCLVTGGGLCGSKACFWNRKQALS